MLKAGVLASVARAAPLTWRWRAPGSLLVLMYHRVLPPDSCLLQTEQQGMFVSPQTLDLHLSEIRRHFELVNLDDWLRRAARGAPLPRLACALTFDDGWRDNWQYGLPVLRKHAAPAMIFLVSSYLGSRHQYWPNTLIGLLKRSLTIPGSVMYPPPLRHIVEPVLAEATRRGAWRPTEIDRIIEQAKCFDESRIRALVCEAGGSCTEPAADREILDQEEIAQLSASGLVRFGSHTATHYRLGGQASAREFEQEIVLSKKYLRDVCGQEIDVFCYPNGDTSPEALGWVRRHYLGAVTARPGWHRPASDPHLIRRIPLHERGSNTRNALLARITARL